MLIADNIQGTHPAVVQAVTHKNPLPVQKLALRCEAAGAEALDINPGHLAGEADAKMAFLVEAVQAVTNLPLVIDTANPIAMAEGLKACKNRVIVNGFSLEPHKLDAILPLAREWDADVIGYLLGPDGRVPTDAAGRLDAALTLYEVFSAAGLEDERLIIDPVVVPVWWQEGNRQARDVLETLQSLPALLGFPVATVAGLSNLTSGGPKKESRHRLEAAYLAMLAASGATHILLNVFHREAVRLARACRMLLEPGVFAWGELD